MFRRLRLAPAALAVVSGSTFSVLMVASAGPEKGKQRRRMMMLPLLPFSVSSCEAAALLPSSPFPSPSFPAASTKTSSYLGKVAASSLRLLEGLERITVYALLAIPALLLAGPAYLLRDLAPLFEELFWAYGIWSLEMLGPAFVKMAQWASTRPDLYPKQLTERLERLQDQVSASTSFSAVESTLTKAFGERWREVLTLERSPIGSGCIAQVYKGILRTAPTPLSQPPSSSSSSSSMFRSKTHSSSSSSSPSPQDQVVAVKILHPNIERRVRLDMQLLASFADLIDTFPRLEILSLGDSIRQFVAVMQRYTVHYHHFITHLKALIGNS